MEIEPRDTRDEPEVRRRSVRIAVGDATLDGDLAVPVDAIGLVVFAHGSGSSRHSSRNKAVARYLERGGLATLLLDLLTRDEEAVDLRTRHLRFDIDLLAHRLIGAVDWARGQPELAPLRVGLFGSSTGAAAALVAASRRSEVVHAVVSRGGRPDLAGHALDFVTAPTLLMVGGADVEVIPLNEVALAKLKRGVLEIVPGATHLFEEPGALAEVAHRASLWFEQHLPV